jgi:hypothetical protein
MCKTYTTENATITFICISNYFKGNDFLINLKKQGNGVYLIASEKLRNKAWATEYIDEIFYMYGQDVDWNSEDLLAGVCGLMRSKKIGYYFNDKRLILCRIYKYGD